MTPNKYPWTATFTDKTSISQLVNPAVPFREVKQKKDLLYSFEVHLAPDRAIGVRLGDGFFYYRACSLTEEFAGPRHVLAPMYELIYSRTCGGDFRDGKITAEVMYYTLGWRCSDGQEQLMRIYPTGEWGWV